MSERFGQDLILLEKLAAGGMAEVYRAKQRGYGGFEKILALKRILPNFAANEEFKQMFRMEANLSGNLQHPNIVQVFGNGEVGGYLYLTMEFVDGKNVRQLLARCDKKKMKVPIPFACFIVAEAAKGLDYAHRYRDDTTGETLEIIHRDMSPQNIMLGYEGAVKIVDFGIAKAAARADTTRAGVLKGKFNYMSPEQATGQKLDKRTDIFALGIILFELVTQRRLFSSDDDMRTLQLVKDRRVPRPSKYNPAVPPTLDRIILKALSKDRNNRYASGDELSAELQHFMNQKYPKFLPRDLSKFVQELFREDIVEDRKRRERLSAEAPATLPSPPPVNAPKVSDDLVAADPDRTNLSDAEKRRTMISTEFDADNVSSLDSLAAADEADEKDLSDPDGTQSEGAFESDKLSLSYEGLPRPSGSDHTKIDGQHLHSFTPGAASDSTMGLEVESSSGLPSEYWLDAKKTQLSEQPRLRSKRLRAYLMGAVAVLAVLIFAKTPEEQSSSGGETPEGGAQAQNNPDVLTPSPTLEVSTPVVQESPTVEVPPPEVAVKEPEVNVPSPEASALPEVDTSEQTKVVQEEKPLPEATVPVPNMGTGVRSPGSVPRNYPPGFISLESIPVANRIYVNRKLLVDANGNPLKTPLVRHALPAGEYTLELENTVYGLRRSSEQIKIEADRLIERDVVLK